MPLQLTLIQRVSISRHMCIVRFIRQSYIFFTFNLHKSKKYYYLCAAKPISGCSSARLEYTSGGRVVASSNLVIPTKLSKQESSIERLRTFFYACTPNACILGCGGIKKGVILLICLLLTIALCSL